MDCAPLCHTTCSNFGQTSPCPVVCVRGCGCLQDMAIDEDQRRCVMPSQCPNKTCSVAGQIVKSCASICPQDCFSPANTSCVIEVCAVDTCECEGVDEVVDNIVGRCVQQEQCTACPIDGQEYTNCGSSCPRTCDNFNDTIICTTDCWQGCECPSGTVIDVEKRKCVDPSQCGREMPTTVDRRVQDESYCTPRFVCPHNEGLDDYNVCQYAVEVMQVFKGTHQVGQILTEVGPDLLSTCGYPRNILSVGTTYVAGIGGPCSFYREWTPYNNFSREDIQRLNNDCSSAGLQLPNILLVFLLASVVIFDKFI
ncbi:von Willebrand factor-like [Dysidea avara]|uniref:von Willebrand factor-like n=1 Tax=Dysidea avara TaxID=196820 RepID=UPI0033317520